MIEVVGNFTPLAWIGYPHILEKNMETINSKRVWQDAKVHEIDWWRDFISGEGLHWKDEFKMRLDPTAPLQEHITRWIDPELSFVSILDVGAGPFTMLGKKWADRKVKITAIDPLASEYNAILRDRRIKPPVLTELCVGEELDSRFQPNSFDLCHSRNALDHSYDPIRIIKNMLLVTKFGGYCILDHAINEGRNAKYQGLHQWDFSYQDGDMLVTSRAGVTSSVTSNIIAKGNIVHLQEGAPQAGGQPGDTGWLFVVIKKTESKL